MKSTAYLTVGLGAETVGAPLMQVREVVLYRAPNQVPHATGGLLGMIHLRDRVMAVLDLAHLLGLPGKTAVAYQHVVVVEIAGTLVGLAVDEVKGIVEAPEAGLMPPPDVAGGTGGSIVGILLNGDRLITCIDLATLPVSRAAALAA